MDKFNTYCGTFNNGSYPKNKSKSILEKIASKFKKENIEHLYVYGNGVYSSPFWTRVKNEFDKIDVKHNIVGIKYYKFTPRNTYIDKDGYSYSKGDELIIDFIVEN